MHFFWRSKATLGIWVAPLLAGHSAVVRSSFRDVYSYTGKQATMISVQSIALQLRFLQRVEENSSEHNSKTFCQCQSILFAPLVEKG